MPLNIPGLHMRLLRGSIPQANDMVDDVCHEPIRRISRRVQHFLDACCNLLLLMTAHSVHSPRKGGQDSDEMGIVPEVLSPYQDTPSGISSGHRCPDL